MKNVVVKIVLQTFLFVLPIISLNSVSFIFKLRFNHPVASEVMTLSGLSLAIVFYYLKTKQNIKASFGSTYPLSKMAIYFGLSLPILIPFFFFFIWAYGDWFPGKLGLSWSWFKNATPSVEFLLFRYFLSAFYEEWYFRGLFYDFLSKNFFYKFMLLKLPVNSVILWSSLIFALVHIPRHYNNIFFAFIVGVILGILREKTGNIIVPSIFHLLLNGESSVVKIMLENL